ncbi:MAG: pyridoxamine 5'-phosphate oxidase family protein [Acidimicrobiia bacterium]|nr:pyridoxamine 5'-phosphate oxidase family protein [Acidimicrobiia bacterium]
MDAADESQGEDPGCRCDVRLLHRGDAAHDPVGVRGDRRAVVRDRRSGVRWLGPSARGRRHCAVRCGLRPRGVVDARLSGAGTEEVASPLVNDRTTLRRYPDRGSHDRETIDAIFREALICHVGFTDDEGRPIVIPTIHALVGDTLYLHGSVASRMLRTLREGSDVCINVAIVDGLVMARSHFNHSMNYRSVVVFGTTRLVDDPAEKYVAFEAIAEHVAPGRWDDARQPTEVEDRQTMVVAVSLDEASAKMRTGGPHDDEADHDLDVWAGVVPVKTTFGTPIADPDAIRDVELPGYLREYRRPSS